MEFDINDYLFTPERLTDIQSWHGLIPFAYYLTKNHQPKIFVELGTHKGDSYCSFCQAVEKFGVSCKCFAVDNWKGDDHSKQYSENIYSELSQYNELYTDFSTLIKSDFDEALDRFENGSIDLLHIDGFHTYDAVKNDFYTWKSKLSKSAIVLFHDICVKDPDFGVHKFWDEIKNDYPSFELRHSNGLGVLAYGQNIANFELFALTKPEKKLIMQSFELAGKLVTTTSHNKQLAEESTQLKQQLDIYSSELIPQLRTENFDLKKAFDDLNSSRLYQVFTRVLSYKNLALDNCSLLRKLYYKVKDLVA